MASISVALPRDLDDELMAWARRNNLTRSQVVRELLRQALGHADPVGRGWREGFAAGQAEVIVAQNKATFKVAKKAGHG